ncbi:MAG: ATP-grasp domain-containing protein [Anaeroplasmataceae bacterium]|nr:ATP-grasp domain-containing protein [Anaeroplasmataceae bacterium]MDE6415235.1 ATP-grasp domain-containing protein [Anaeroplasmataceae bacterium]
MKLGILFGGASYEHEISIITAYQLKKKIEKEYEVHLLYVNLEGKFFNADKMQLNDFKHSQYKKLKKLKLDKLKLDVIVGAMHGENGEDGLACAFARIHCIPYLGCDVFAGSLSLDKYRSYLYLSKNGVKMVKTMGYTYEDYLKNKKIPYMPCIIKPVYGGSSIGITIAKTKEELPDKLNEAFTFSKEVIIEPYYEVLEEYNLALNENTYSELEQIHKKDEIFSFDNKYSDSFKVVHQSIIEHPKYEDFCKVARKVYHLINAKGIIRIDFFLIDDEIYVNEINTTPGALAMYLFSDFTSVFRESLKLSLQEKKKTYPESHFLLKNNINK